MSQTPGQWIAARCDAIPRIITMPELIALLPPNVRDSIPPGSTGRLRWFISRALHDLGAAKSKNQVRRADGSKHYEWTLPMTITPLEDRLAAAGNAHDERIRQAERNRCLRIARFAEQQCTTPVGQGVANAIAKAIENPK